MDADQKEICEILLQTKGNRQYVKNVFGTNWLPYVTSYYGYRVHPISGEKNYHTGVDIGMPQGTEILAGHDGTVTLAGNAGGYGLCVAIEGEAYEGHSLTTKYGHCSQILVSAGQEVKAGDVIAKVGSTGNSTGPHLHLEVLVDGQYRNPLYFADTGDTSERHLPAAGAGGGGNYFDYDVPPEALALLAVGGVGYYVKIVRPKQQAEDDEDFEDDGYGEGFDPDEAYGEPEYLSEDDFDDRIDDEQEDSE